jgi:hypothetical protein
MINYLGIYRNNENSYRNKIKGISKPFNINEPVKLD